MLEFTLRRKIARVVKQLAETLDISHTRALCLFYATDTCRLMHDEACGIHYQSDTYIVNNVLHELQDQ